MIKKFNRGFEVISEHNLGESFKMPKRATVGSAGYDFYNNTGEDIIIEPKSSSKVIRTFISAFMKEDEVFQMYVRSSIGFKYNTRIQNLTPIIDSDYNKEIFIKLYNDSLEVVTIKSGEAFVQGIFQKFLVTWNDSTKEERIGGIGSTSK